MSGGNKDKKNEKLSRAMKGNQNAIGNNGGRPPLYDNVEDLSNKVLEYFEWIQGEYEEREGKRTYNKKGEEGKNVKVTETYTYKFCLRNPETPSITGLAIFLGFESRQSLYDYSEKAEFSYSIKKALLKIENNYEKGLWNDKCTGVIFALKNMNWNDSKTIKGDKDNPITVNQIVGMEIK